MSTVKQELDVAQLQLLADCLRKVQIGEVLHSLANPVENEALALVADVHTCVNKVMYPMSVDVLTVGPGGGPTGGYDIIPKGQTPATGECAFDVSSKTITFLAADLVATGVVSYIKKPTNLVANLAATSF